jgi:hypothetical protein
MKLNFEDEEVIKSIIKACELEKEYKKNKEDVYTCDIQDNGFIVGRIWIDGFTIMYIRSKKTMSIYYGMKMKEPEKKIISSSIEINDERLLLDTEKLNSIIIKELFNLEEKFIRKYKPTL